MREVDFYGPADRAVQSMNREIVRDFGTLRMAKFDELNVIRDVKAVYRKQRRKARSHFYEMAMEAFLLGMYLCGISGKKAQKMADGLITLEWVDAILGEVSPVTKYRFDTETERKAQRLAEALIGAAAAVSGTPEAEEGGKQTGVSGGGGRKPTGLGPGAEIDKAMRDWSRQVGQESIEITDAAVMEAYAAAGIPRGMWVTERDQRVCPDCHQLDGKVFLLSEVPTKPHRNCRCRIMPVMSDAETTG